MKWVYRICVLNVLGISWALAATWPTWPTSPLGQSPPDSLRAIADTPNHREAHTRRIAGVITVALKPQSPPIGTDPAARPDEHAPSFPPSEPIAPDASVAPPESQPPEAKPQTPRVIAYCVFSGISERFVITSDEKLLKISENGEVAMVGILTAPISGDYFCMIRTEKWVVGVSKKGHLVSLISGAILGAVIPLE